MSPQIVPTKNNLINTKKSLSLAELGYDLLDRKTNILVREMMDMIGKARIIQSQIDEIYADAYIALQKANLTLGICQEAANTVPVDMGLNLDRRSVMGIELPIVSLKEQSADIYYGLGSTNSKLDEAYIKFNEVKQLTVKLSEVEGSVYRLADAIKKTKKRTNALNNIIIPNFKSNIRNISDALEEKEREDFSRLKVIKERKKY